MIRVSDLPNLTGTKRTEPDPFLYCEVCGDHYSANAGDYWAVPKDHVFTCCDEPMRLVREVTQLVDALAGEDDRATGESDALDASIRGSGHE